MGNQIDRLASSKTTSDSSPTTVVVHKANDMPSSRMRARPYSKGTAVEIAYDDDDDDDMRRAGRYYFDEKNPPPPNSRILLHSCCAPCSGAMFEEMLLRGYDVTIFFYNPNIHPRREYEIRKTENKRYAEKHGVPFVDCDYDARSWFQRMKGLENDPERLGKRCVACFDMRMEVTAAYARRHGFDAFTTTNATSRWKDESQVNGSGLRAARNMMSKRDDHKKSPRFWLYRWQTDAFTKRKYEISAEERFYKQEYCGCSYSLRDSNAWRKLNGIPPVRIGGTTAGMGTRYFEDAKIDADEESQEVVDSFFASFKRPENDEGTTQIENILKGIYAHRKKSSSTAVKEKAALNNW